MLRPMDRPARDRYIGEATVRFGETLARVFELPADEANRRAREHLDEILPERGGTQLHHFHDIVSEGDVVGAMWFAERPDDDPPRIYLYEIFIGKGARGKGHGHAAMTELEQVARDAGMKEIVLSVFAYNKGAIRLYERLGYKTTERGERGRRMTKSL